MQKKQMQNLKLKAELTGKVNPQLKLEILPPFLNSQYRTRHEVSEDAEELKLSIALSVKSAPTLASLHQMMAAFFPTGKKIIT